MPRMLGSLSHFFTIQWVVLDALEELNEVFIWLGHDALIPGMLGHSNALVVRKANISTPSLTSKAGEVERKPLYWEVTPAYLIQN